MRAGDTSPVAPGQQNTRGVLLRYGVVVVAVGSWVIYEGTKWHHLDAGTALVGAAWEAAVGALGGMLGGLFVRQPLRGARRGALFCAFSFGARVMSRGLTPGLTLWHAFLGAQIVLLTTVDLDTPICLRWPRRGAGRAGPT